MTNENRREVIFTSWAKLLRDRTNDDAAELFLRRILRRFRIVKRSRLLEVGCGDGWLSERLASDYFVDAIDVLPGMIELARNTHPHRRVRYVCKDVRAWKHREYDAAWSWGHSLGYGARSRLREEIAALCRMVNSRAPVILDFRNRNDVLRRMREDGGVYRSGSARCQLPVVTSERYANGSWFLTFCVPRQVSTPVSAEVQVRLPSFGSLSSMLPRHWAVRAYGDYELRRYDERRSPRLILVASASPALPQKKHPDRILRPMGPENVEAARCKPLG